jgi:single-stranded-DNA-specific exonuclease
LEDLLSSPIFEKPSSTGRTWELREPDEEKVSLFMRQLDLPEILARLLSFRASSVEEARTFLSPTLKKSLPDPSVLQGMDEAVARVEKAILEKEEILIWGDYDVDGITSTVLLLRFFSSIGISASFHVPTRAQGYGATQDTLHSVWKDEAPPRLVLMVDCGVTAHETLEELRSRGADVVVLDHHAPEDTIPQAHAIVDPYLPGNPEELKQCCAAGVVFLFLVGLNRALRSSFPSYQEPDLRLLLDLVALGTVCDVMPLVELNRAYVAQGLKVINGRTNLGIRELARVACLRAEISVHHIAFSFGPRLNAPGRLDNAEPSVRLLLSQTGQEAASWAVELDRLNRERQELEVRVVEKAQQLAQAQRERPFLVISGDNWAAGVLGIVAGRLREQFYKPCCVISFDDEGNGRGSGRSVPGMDLGSIIHQAKAEGLVVNGGGHALAAGFSLQRARLEDLESFLQKSAQEKDFRSPPLVIEGTLSLSGATIGMVHLLKQLGPFGAGNPTPQFLFQNVSIEHTQRVGKDHLACVLTQGDGVRVFSVLFRSTGTVLERVLSAKRGSYDIVGVLNANLWRGKFAPQIHITDVMER